MNHSFDTKPLYDIYRVKIRFRDKVCGGTPKNPELLAGWIAATTEHKDEKTDAQVDEAKAALLEPAEEKSWNGFPMEQVLDTTGVFLWSRQIKALFKECATMLRLTLDKRGSKQIFQHGFEIKGLTKEDRVFLKREHVVAKADGYDEGPIHVATAQGPRTAIKRVDYVEKATLEFDVWVLSTATAETRHIGEKDIVKMLTFGQENGLGADRSQGRGKFDVIDFHVVQHAERNHEEDAVKASTKGNKKVKEKETKTTEAS
jgi:hypothetical protein